MEYQSCLTLPVFAVALVLCGCTELPPRAVPDNAEPPAWNSLEMMLMNTEIVLVNPSRENNPGAEPASAAEIAAPHSSS